MAMWVQVPPLSPNLITFHFIMFGAIKHLIPQPHGYMDDNNLYNLGLTWVDQDGLTDVRNLQVRYTRNSERMAITQGEMQPDGSWAYKEANGTVHTMSAERSKAFMAKTQENANIMVEMLSKMEKAGVDLSAIDIAAS